MKKETLYTLNEDLTYTPKEVEIYEGGDRTIFNVLGTLCGFLLIFSLVQIKEKKTSQETNTKLQEENRALKDDLRLCENQSLMILNERHVDAFIDQLPFSDKELIKNQYRNESGHLKSDLAKYSNNIFGMKTSSRKHSYMGVGEKNYVIYGHWTLSVIDRLLYEIYVGTSLKNYSTNPNYKKLLK